MRGIVWTTDFNIGCEKLKQIIQSYKRLNHFTIELKKTKSEYVAVFGNGDYWRVVRAIEGARGYKCNVSYIDQRISTDFINTIIQPATIAAPWHGFCYFDGSVDE